MKSGQAVRGELQSVWYSGQSAIFGFAVPSAFLPGMVAFTGLLAFMRLYFLATTAIRAFAVPVVAIYLITTVALMLSQHRSADYSRDFLYGHYWPDALRAAAVANNDSDPGFMRWSPLLGALLFGFLLCAKNADFEGMIKGGGSAVAYAWYVVQKVLVVKLVVEWIN